MPKSTVANDNWQCPWCKEHQHFESETAQATAIADLSGFVDDLTCAHCGKASTVSLSIQYRAEPLTG